MSNPKLGIALIASAISLGEFDTTGDPLLVVVNETVVETREKMKSQTVFS